MDEILGLESILNNEENIKKNTFKIASDQSLGLKI